MNGLVGCVVCRESWVTPSQLVCPRCQRASSSPDLLMSDLRASLQQHRVVIPYRFSDTKKFLNVLRATARAAGMEPVVGPTVVRVVGQRSQYPGDCFTAYRMVSQCLDGVGFGGQTEVKSWSVTLVDGGYAWTMVEVRGMLREELAGTGGVAR